MNINTTLLIFAVLAALGLMTALMVVEPNVAKAVGPGDRFWKVHTMSSWESASSTVSSLN